MQEVGRAVERVDVPGMRLVTAFDFAALLHHEAVPWARFTQFLEHGFLGAIVGSRHEITGTLDRHLEVFDLPEVAFKPAPGLEDGSGHDVHQGGTDHCETLRDAARVARPQ